MSDHAHDQDRLQMPPPSSQSHFDTFANFKPNNTASFDDEFARLASSQQWVPGSQDYKRERTIAMREELKLHYFPASQPQPNDIDTVEPQPAYTNAGGRARQSEKKLTPEERLAGYQALCTEVGIELSEDVDECKRRLKNALANIVDLIDARRTEQKVEVWEDFEAFKDYTLQDEHRIDLEEAKSGGEFLESLLQKLRGAGDRRQRRRGRKTRGGRVKAGRVVKMRA